MAVPAGPYARIAILRPHDGDTVDFEAGFNRHLDWHRQAKDTWVWYGWTIWAGDRQRWLVYASFGHSPSELDNPVSPLEDERDNIVNVIRHGRFMGQGLYEFRPGLSRGTPIPTPTARVEMTTVESAVGEEEAFESAIAAGQSALRGETLWFRMLWGGDASRYVRLRPRRNLSALLEPADDDQLRAAGAVRRVMIEIMNLRPAMSYGVVPEP